MRVTFYSEEKTRAMEAAYYNSLSERGKLSAMHEGMPSGIATSLWRYVVKVERLRRAYVSLSSSVEMAAYKNGEDADEECEILDDKARRASQLGHKLSRAIDEAEDAQSRAMNAGWAFFEASGSIRPRVSADTLADWIRGFSAAFAKDTEQKYSSIRDALAGCGICGSLLEKCLHAAEMAAQKKGFESHYIVPNSLLDAFLSRKSGR